MSTEANKSVVRCFIEDVMGKGVLEAIPEIISPDWVNNDPLLPPLRGQDGARQLALLFRSGIPDFHMVLEDIVAEGDKVAFRSLGTGTHTGELMGVPPSGRPIHVTATGIVRLSNGKIVENTVNVDGLSLMQQIGVAPVPGPH